MGKRFYYDEFLEEIYDEQIDDYPTNRTICEILNQQSQRIAELEEQLKNAIAPKFKVGDVLFYIFRDAVEFMRVYCISRFRDNQELVFYGDGFGVYWSEQELFATKEEAQAKLKEE